MRKKSEKLVTKFGLLPGAWEELPAKYCLRLHNRAGSSVGVVALPKELSVFELAATIREACNQAKDYIERYNYA